MLERHACGKLEELPFKYCILSPFAIVPALNAGRMLYQWASYVTAIQFIPVHLSEGNGALTAVGAGWLSQFKRTQLCLDDIK